MGLSRIICGCVCSFFLRFSDPGTENSLIRVNKENICTQNIFDIDFYFCFFLIFSPFFTVKSSLISCSCSFSWFISSFHFIHFYYFESFPSLFFSLLNFSFTWNSDDSWGSSWDKGYQSEYKKASFFILLSSKMYKFYEALEVMSHFVVMYFRLNLFPFCILSIWSYEA